MAKPKRSATEQLVCGCVVQNGGPALYAPCDYIRRTYTQATELVRKGMGLTKQERFRLEQLQGSIARHVKAERTKTRGAPKQAARKQRS